MRILDYLEEDKVFIDLKKEGKKKVIERIVSLLMKTGFSGDPDKAVNALMEREKTGSTGIGNGIAIPHAKTDAVDSVAVAYARSSAGVEFDAVDGKPVKHFFMVVSPSADAAVQLRLLARISRLMGNRLFRSELEKAKTPAGIICIIGKYDQ
jgi:fructose-specific phosphotransferase system IIA component